MNFGSSLQRKKMTIFDIGRESLQLRFQSIGCCPLLDDNTGSALKLYLSSLDSMYMQQTICQTSHIIQVLSQNITFPSGKSCTHR